MRDFAHSMKVTGTDYRKRGKQGDRHYFVASILLAIFLAITLCGTDGTVRAQGTGPSMLHPNLALRPIVSGLITPITMAFLGTNDILVLEKNTGKVKRVVNGAVQSTVLDLAVNFAS